MLDSSVAYLLWMLGFFLGFPVLHRLYMGKINLGTFLRFIPGLGHILSFFDLFSIPAEIEAINLRRASQGHLNAAQFACLEGTRPQTPTDLEQLVLRAAKKNKGIITTGDFALEAKIPLSEAKQFLDKLAKQGLVEMRVRRSGVVVYTFPEFMDGGADNELLDI